MDDCLGYAVVAVLLSVAAGFILWVLLATLLSLLSWLVLLWAAEACLMALAGLAVGMTLPYRVLSGRCSTQPEVATPDEVAAGHVIRRRPWGFTRNFGWDQAWPEYLPFQARRDAAAVRAETRSVLARAWAKIGGRTRPSPDQEQSRSDQGDEAGVDEATSPPQATRLQSVRSVGSRLLWWVVAGPGYAGFALGVWLAYGTWLLVVLVPGGVGYAGQQAVMLAYRWLDRGRLLRRRAQVLCPHCYERSPRPSYRCPNPACTVVHRDISPGPLGIIARRCACGTRFWTTVAAASRSLVALCPVCDAELSGGSGARHTIQLPVFGAVGAGKTRFFAAALVAAQQQLSHSEGRLEPLGATAEGFLKASEQAIASGEATDKTVPTARPEGHPVKVTDASGRELELQLMDAAGESFASILASEELTYVNFASTMLFVLDPLALPQVRAELRADPDLAGVVVAAGEQEDAYASVVDRIRSEAVNVSRKHLAVVLTKADILSRLPSGQSLDPSTSASVRGWLVAQQEDGLVRRLESDFGDVHYCVVSSLERRPPDDPLSPLGVLQWCLQTQKASLSLVPTGPEVKR